MKLSDDTYMKNPFKSSVFVTFSDIVYFCSSENIFIFDNNCNVSLFSSSLTAVWKDLYCFFTVPSLSIICGQIIFMNIYKNYQVKGMK